MFSWFKKKKQPTPNRFNPNNPFAFGTAALNSETELRHYVDMLRKELYTVAEHNTRLMDRVNRLERLLFDNKLSNDKIDAILKAFDICQGDANIKVAMNNTATASAPSFLAPRPAGYSGSTSP